MAQFQQPPEGGVGAGDASSGGGIPDFPETDQQVIDAVKTAFFLDPDLPEDVCDVVSIDRVVYLSGVVATPDLKRRAQEVAAQVQGVNRVVNQLQVANAGI